MLRGPESEFEHRNMPEEEVETMKPVIYALCEPGTRTVRYIGKANDAKQRLRQHIHESRGYLGGRTHRDRWILSVLDRGLRPEVLILLETSISEWRQDEQRFIAGARMLGMPLVNATDGGDGVEGLVHSPQTRLLLSIRGRGRKASEETRRRMSEAKSGVNHPFYGKTLSKSHRQNNSLGHKQAFKALKCLDAVRQLSEGTR